MARSLTPSRPISSARVTFTYQVADANDTGNIATVSLTRQSIIDITAGQLTIVGTADS